MTYLASYVLVLWLASGDMVAYDHGPVETCNLLAMAMTVKPTDLNGSRIVAAQCVEESAA